MKNKTYQWHTNSNAAPFCSDSDSGFIEAGSPMEALKKIVSEYKHPAGLYAATINEPTVENKMVARYLSARANTASKAGTGLYETRNGELYVNDKPAKKHNEIYETF